jgi:PKD repeat protein
LTAGQTNVDVVVTGVSASGSEYFDPGPDIGGPGFSNHITAFITTDVIVNSVTFSNPTNITLNVSVAPDATPGARSIMVTNPDKQITNSAFGILTVIAPPPVVNFDASPVIGGAPLTVYFTNLTTGATDYAWDFGDASSSTNANPINTYTNAGSYTVTLTAVGSGGTNTLSKTNFIAVTYSISAPALMISGYTSTNFLFSFDTLSGKTYLVQYKDLLTDPDWQLLSSVPGDGIAHTITNSFLDSPQRFFRLTVQ